MSKKRRTKINFSQLDMPDSKAVKGSDSFNKCLRMFIDECEVKNLSSQTIIWYKDHIKTLYKALKELNLPTDPAKITEQHIKQCILYWKKEKNLMPTSINHKIKAARAFFKFLCQQKIIDDLPTRRVETLRTKKVIIKPFSDDQLRKLFAQPDKSTFVGFRDYTFMLVLLDTGVRLRELENMKVNDVNLQDNKILVLGKGAKEREVYFQKTTGEYLRRYLIIRGELEHDFLWINNDDTPMKRRNFQRRLQEYGRKAKIKNVRVSPHTFRHTCAKKYITKGGDMISLQNLLGHSTLEMVRHYVHLWGADLKKAHKKFSPVEDLFND